MRLYAINTNMLEDAVPATQTSPPRNDTGSDGGRELDDTVAASAADQSLGADVAAPALDWDSLTRGQAFITDLGFEPNYLQPMPNGPPLLLGRYAAFLPVPDSDRHQIQESSNDIEYLRAKYDCSEDRVLRIMSASD